MRTIKFRGKRIDNNEWVYGYYVKDPKGNHKIYFQPFDDATSNTYFLVKPESVGQYSGVNDKNGTEIYEKDIVENKKFIGRVHFKDGCFAISNWAISFMKKNHEVVGNVIDNPDLMIH